MFVRTESPQTALPGSRPTGGFTLVELLVVIAIIGVLAALIAGVAPGVIQTARETAVLTEISQLATALKAYKAKHGSYPPNFTDPTQVVRHARKRWPRIHAHEIEEIVALNLTPAQALVFWLRGFSPDPVHPHLGRGERTPVIEFDKTRLAIVVPGQPPTPVAEFNPGIVIADALFADLDPSVTPEPNHVGRTGIPIPSYLPPKISGQPYVYFASQSYVVTLPSTQAQSEFTAPNGAVVRPVKTRISSTNNLADNEYAEPENFQILCAGMDGEWYGPASYQANPFDLIPYPQGPFANELADTLTNFSTKSLEDSQP